MKNIFKFMGVALIAGSMLFVACGKDEPEDNNTTEETTYTLTLKVNDAAMGTVTATPQKEAYKEGDTVVLTATANNGFEFANWSDGITDATRTIVVKGNATYTANFVVYVADHATINFGDDVTWEATTIGGKEVQGGLRLVFWKDYQSTTTPSLSMIGGKAKGSFAMSQDNDYTLFYFNFDDDYFEIGESEYPTWQPMQFTQTVTEIDLTEQTISFTAEATVYNLSEAEISEQGVNTANATKKTVTIDAKCQWLSLQKGKML